MEVLPGTAADSLIELVQLDRIMERSASLHGEGLLTRKTVASVHSAERLLPIDVLEMGSTDTSLPCVGFFAGVHGVERIGSQIVLYFLHNLVERMAWDRNLQDLLNQVRLVFMPVINPVGILRHRRSNGNGVDLMRNAPVDADGKVPFLVGGHRLGPWLPWYRGRKAAGLELEARAVVDVVRQEVAPHSFSITIDCHSGFGAQDRLWFPWAKTSRPFDHLAEVYALKRLWDTSYPFHHHYAFEPQSHQYMTHGDLWDYIYLQSLDASENVLLPLTLEMGSWLWVKKNPRQLFSMLGAFHPLVQHRFKRVLRQHLPFFEFAIRAAREHEFWLPDPVGRQSIFESAKAYWKYDGK